MSFDIKERAAVNSVWYLIDELSNKKGNNCKVITFFSIYPLINPKLLRWQELHWINHCHRFHVSCAKVKLSNAGNNTRFQAFIV